MKEKYFIYLQKKRRRRKNMKQENNRIQLPLEEIKLAFAASCVEGAARKLGVPYIEIYERMRKVDLIFCPTTIRSTPKVESIL